MSASDVREEWDDDTGDMLYGDWEDDGNDTNLRFNPQVVGTAVHERNSIYPAPARDTQTYHESNRSFVTRDLPRASNEDSRSQIQCPKSNVSSPTFSVSGQNSRRHWTLDFGHWTPTNKRRAPDDRKSFPDHPALASYVHKFFARYFLPAEAAPCACSEPCPPVVWRVSRSRMRAALPRSSRK